MNGRSRFSRGQMLVLLALILPALLGGLALGADFSIIYFSWAMVQKAADAAALAGASQLTGKMPRFFPSYRTRTTDARRETAGADAGGGRGRTGRITAEVPTIA